MQHSRFFFTTVINFNRYLLKRLNTIFEKPLVLRFTTCYKIRQRVVTIYDSLHYYTSRQHVITIYDRSVITIHDTCYYISGQVLQYTTSVITIHDGYYNSRYYYISRQNIHFLTNRKVVEELLELITLELNWENIYSRCFDLRTGRLLINFPHLSCSKIGKPLFQWNSALRPPCHILKSKPV